MRPCGLRAKQSEGFGERADSEASRGRHDVVNPGAMTEQSSESYLEFREGMESPSSWRLTRRGKSGSGRLRTRRA